MKIIIEDGSAIVRAIIEQNLKNYPEIKIIASLSNAKKVAHFVADERPDVIILGGDTNDSDEQESLALIFEQLHIPVIFMVDSKSSLTCLPASAETVEKPRLNGYTKEFFDSLVQKIQKISSVQAVRHSDSAKAHEDFKILCIGASTGGPTAVSQVLLSLGENFPLPVLYTQHLEVGADKTMAAWFSSVCHNFQIKLAQNGEVAKPGFVYMAPADKHLVIDFVEESGLPLLKLSDEEPERFLRPAVNKLFRSAAKFYKKNCLAVLLTGMGADGAEGCREICCKGGWTIVEDKSTCAVFGMPAAAIEAGGAKEVLPRGEISKRILELVNNDSK